MDDEQTIMTDQELTEDCGILEDLMIDPDKFDDFMDHIEKVMERVEQGSAPDQLEERKAILKDLLDRQLGFFYGCNEERSNRMMKELMAKADILLSKEQDDTPPEVTQ